jgi:hypothetical protein
MFLTPEPSSSTSPISLKNLAIKGFFGNGEKLFGLILPYPCGLLLFSVEISELPIISFAGYGFAYSR